MLWASAILSLACCFYFSILFSASVLLFLALDIRSRLARFTTNRACPPVETLDRVGPQSKYDILRIREKSKSQRYVAFCTQYGAIHPQTAFSFLFLPLGSLLLQHRVRSPSPAWDSGTQGWHSATFRSQIAWAIWPRPPHPITHNHT